MSILSKKYGTVKELTSLYFEIGRNLYDAEEYSEASKNFERAIRLKRIERKDKSRPVQQKSGDTSWYRLFEKYLPFGTSDSKSTPMMWELKYALGTSSGKLHGEEQFALRTLFKSISEPSAQADTILDQAFQIIERTPSIDETLINSLIKEVGYSGSQESVKFDLLRFEGQTLTHFHRHEEAIKVFKNAQGLNKENTPEQRELIVLICKALVKLRKIDEALNMVTGTLEQKGLSTKHSLQLKLIEVECQYKLGNLELAHEKFDSVQEDLKDLESNKKLTKDYDLLKFNSNIIQADLQIRSHEYSAALEMVERCLEKANYNIDLLFLKVQALIEGQINIELGLEEFYLIIEDVSTDINNRLADVLIGRPNDGNVQLFLGHIQLLLDADYEIVYHHIDLAKKFGTQKIQGVKGPDLYPEIGLRILQGELENQKYQSYELTSSNDEGSQFDPNEAKKLASSHFFDAAEYFRLAGNYDSADIYYEKTIELDPDNQKACWTLADNTVVKSYTTNPPVYRDPELIEEAKRIWYLPEDSHVSNREDYWAYTVAGFIHESKGRIEQSREEFWRSTFFHEKALLVEDSYLHPWLHLAIAYRNVDLWKNAMVLLNIAELIDFDNNFRLLEERTVQYLNSLHEEAPMLVSEIRKGSDSPYYIGYEGFLDFHAKDFKNAISHFNQFRNEFPNDLWGAFMLMLCYWCQPDIESARDIAKEILTFKYQTDFETQYFYFGSAHFIMGQYNEAAYYFMRDIEPDNRKISGSHGWYNLSLLFVEDSEKTAIGFEEFTEWVVLKGRKRDLLFFSMIIHALTEHIETGRFFEAGSPAENLMSILHNWHDTLTSKFQDSEPHPKLTFEDCIIELEQEIEENKYSPGSIEWLAIKCGIARLSFYGGYYENANSVYEELGQYSSKFPEYSIGIEKCLAFLNRAEKDLHPIIDEILDRVRQRTDSKDGEKTVVEEFVIEDRFVKPLRRKFKLLTLAGDEREALLSLFAFSLMVDKKGWPENAERIRQLGTVFGDHYYQLRNEIEERTRSTSR